ncbi:MAG: TetR/AcrR family transcriptional regulator, partial [Ilumatobacteraceae bacterium]
MEGKGLRARQAEETHATLITVARELFTDPGYAATSIEDIIQRAGVARGALYHHFSGKDALFRAVYDSVQAEAVARVMAAAARRAGEPWTAVRAGLSAFLDACLEPTFRRVVIVDSIPVLHQAAFEAGVGRNELPMLRTILTPLVTAHLPDDVDVEPLAYVTLGGLYGAALFIATSPKPK